MHTFQPLSITDLELNVFNTIGNEWMLVTAEKDGKANTMTASWGGLGVMWGKNVAFIFIRESRFTKEFVDHADTLSLSFFGGNQKSALKYLGAVSGRDEDKISNARLTITHHDETPFFDDASMILICKKLSSTLISNDSFINEGIDSSHYKNGDYHTMYIAEITDVLAR